MIPLCNLNISTPAKFRGRKERCQWQLQKNNCLKKLSFSSRNHGVKYLSRWLLLVECLQQPTSTFFPSHNCTQKCLFSFLFFSTRLSHLACSLSIRCALAWARFRWLLRLLLCLSSSIETKFTTQISSHSFHLVRAFVVAKKILWAFNNTEKLSRNERATHSLSDDEWEIDIWKNSHQTRDTTWEQSRARSSFLFEYCLTICWQIGV